MFLPNSGLQRGWVGRWVGAEPSKSVTVVLSWLSCIPRDNKRGGGAASRPSISPYRRSRKPHGGVKSQPGRHTRKHHKEHGGRPLTPPSPQHRCFRCHAALQRRGAALVPLPSHHQCEGQAEADGEVEKDIQ